MRKATLVLTLLFVLAGPGSEPARATIAGPIEVSGKLGDSIDRDSVELIQRTGDRVRIRRALLPPNTPLKPGTLVTVKMTPKEFFTLRAQKPIEQEKPHYTGRKR